MKILIVLIMLGIAISLFTGLVGLIKDKPDSKRMVKALTWRIGLSLFLFVLLFVLFALGFIKPHGILG